MNVSKSYTISFLRKINFNGGLPSQADFRPASCMYATFTSNNRLTQSCEKTSRTVLTKRHFDDPSVPRNLGENFASLGTLWSRHYGSGETMLTASVHLKAALSFSTLLFVERFPCTQCASYLEIIFYFEKSAFSNKLLKRCF